MLRRISAINWVRIICAVVFVLIAIGLIDEKKPWKVLAEIGEPKRVRDFVAIYLWWAAAANALLILLLGATAQWWLTFTPPSSANWLPKPSSPRWFWPLVLCAMALTAFWGIQRANHSVWDDEETSLRRVIIGTYRDNEAGKPVLKPVPWRDTFWDYKMPTNHHLQTILSRLSLDTWRAVAKPRGLQFSEPVLRIPVILAGILSIGAIALLVRRIGYPRAAVAAAFLLALHPWHVRYAAEMRGYSLVMLFVPLMILCALEAINTGRWRWWLGFAFCEFCVLYAYPGCLYLLAITNLAAAITLLLRNAAWERLRQLLRLEVSSGLAGMAYLQLMLPCVPQALLYFAGERSQGQLGERWHRNALSHFLTGTPWNNSDLRSAGYPELKWIAADHPVLFPILAGCILALLALGIFRLARTRPVGWMLLAIFLIPAPLVYAGAIRGGHYLYEWYLIFALPGLAALVALGIDSLAAPTQKISRFAPAAVIVFFVSVFAISTQPQRSFFINNPLQHLREVVLAARPTLDPNDPRQAGIMTATVTGAPLAYDPYIEDVRNAETLTFLLKTADETNRPFFFLYGNGWAAAYGYPELHKMIEDDTLFEKTAELPGYDPTLTEYVRKYRPGAIAQWQKK